MTDPESMPSADRIKPRLLYLETRVPIPATRKEATALENDLDLNNIIAQSHSEWDLHIPKNQAIASSISVPDIELKLTRKIISATRADWSGYLPVAAATITIRAAGRKPTPSLITTTTAEFAWLLSVMAELSIFLHHHRDGGLPPEWSPDTDPETTGAPTPHHLKN